MKKEIARVCQVERLKCDNEIFPMSVNGKIINFCCKKGFEYSVEKFSKELKR